MNTNSKRLGIYITVMLVATSVATALRSVAAVKYLNNATGFYSEKALVTVADVLIVLPVLGMLSYFFVASRISLRSSFSTSATYVPTGILGVATAFLGVRIFSYILTVSNYRPFSYNPYKAIGVRGVITEIMSKQNIISAIGIVAGVFAFISIAHHFFNAYVTDSHSSVRAYFAMSGILFLALYAILVYLDSSISVNESAKTLRQMSFLASAAFLLYETRISLGREMWRPYCVFGLIAASLTAYTSIPAIITYYVNKEIISSSGISSLASLEEYVLLFVLFIFILARLCLTISLPEEKENDLVKAFTNMATEREVEVNESFERHREIFAAKQLSIFDLYGGDESEQNDAPDDIIEEEEILEDKDEIVISDDAIYESIYGKMPERPQNNVDAVEITEDEREPEQIAEDLLNALDEALADSKDKY